MKHRVILCAIVAGTALIAAIAPPAHAFRFDLGLGSLLGRTGLSTGFNYRLGGWDDRLSSFLFLDASQYVNRPRKKRPVEEVRALEAQNVALRVKPANSWVYLNGIRVQADGKHDIHLPPGRHRLEFVLPGYRTEVAELNVEPGIRYKVERKLAKIDLRETWDERYANPGTPVPIAEALKARETTATTPAPPQPAAQSAPATQPDPGAPADTPPDPRR